MKDYPRGLTITEISKKISVNRNSVAKYLDVMLISGEIEQRLVGRAKLFYPSQRIPVSALLDYSSDYIMVFNEKLIVTQVNKKFLELMKLERDEIIGQRLSDAPSYILNDTDLKASIMNCFAEKTPIYEMNYKKIFDQIFRLKFIPTIFNDGSNGVTLIMEDVTEERRIFQELKESDRVLHSFIRSSPSGFILFDSDLNVLEINDAALSLSKFQRENVIGKNMIDFDKDLFSSDHYKKYVEILEGNSRLYMTEVMHPLLGGKTVIISAFPVNDSLGMIVTDISSLQTR
jgi:PAS domain S-box-containing protein